jgi:hypothetical protein
MSQDILAEAWASGVTYTMEEAKRELMYELIKANGINDEDPDVAKVILLMGPHGTGKTQVTKQACEEAGAEYAAYHHGATVEEDNHGLPIVEERNGIKVAGQAKPKHLPCFFRKPESPSGRGALVLHEPFTGGIGHQNILRMMTERQHNSDKMFPGWILMATTNPETAEYVTVKAVDAALASRMIILVVKPSNDEKLSYWSSRMHPTLYKFLLLTNIKKIAFLEKLDSRSWYNLADSVGRRQAAGATRDSLIKLIRTHAGTDVAVGFTQYLEHGDDPYYFPIGHNELVTADRAGMRVITERIKRWLDGNELPLIGATNWDLGVWLREESDKASTKQAAANICEYMQLVGPGGYMDMVDDLFQNARGRKIMPDFMKSVKGTKVEDRLTEIYKQHNENSKIQFKAEKGAA